VTASFGVEGVVDGVEDGASDGVDAGAVSTAGAAEVSSSAIGPSIGAARLISLDRG
jgi:hypothetical protein